MTNSWTFPPNTREVQFDEKWSFVGKKEKHCDPADPADAKQGDNKERTEGRPMNLITSDEYKPYRQAILKAYGKEIVPDRSGQENRAGRRHRTMRRRPI